MTHETYETLAPGYALGTLDGEDLAQFQSHLAKGCTVCLAALREAEETLALLARGTSPVIPPGSVKQALLARIAAAGPRRVEPGRRPRWFPWVAGAIAASLLAFFTGMFVAARYEARLGQVTREAVALRQRVQRQQAAVYHVIDLLREPGTSVLRLSGQGPAPDASASLLWNDRSGGHLLVAGLAPLPPDKTYELWTIRGGTPRPAGLFVVDASGRGGHFVDPVPGGRPEVFAVTIEPAGGAAAPTGPIVVLGGLEGSPKPP
ncbi:MAG: anti-sigma factor [Candidatus Rokuibacteriota bacterium]